MTTFLAITTISIATLAAQTIRPPQMGFAATTGGELQPVYGVAGNFLFGPPIASRVISQAFSGSFGLLKTDSTLAAFDREGKILSVTDAAPGPALFAFSPNGTMGLAYIASSNSLVEWAGAAFRILPFRPAAESIVAIGLPSAFEASFIVQRFDEIWQVNLPLTRARVLSQRALPGVTAPVLAFASGDVVYGDTQGLVLRKPDASEIHIAGPLPKHFSLQQMTSDWVQLRDSNSSRHYAIRLTSGREAFFELPEAAQ
jgi:hypothetical protein